MRQPRIFIHMHYMELGGAERALLGLLNTLDPERVDVDLFLNQHTGVFMPLIPKHVNLLPERRGYNAIERPMKTILKERQWGILYGRLKAKKLHRQYNITLKEPYKSFDSSVFQYVANCVEPILPPLGGIEGGQEPYDLAISFLQPHNIVLNKVKAKKRMAWIHTDYSAIHFNAPLELPVWSGYDYIASISPDCTRAFLSMFPSLKNKIIEIENILSPAFVRQQAEEKADMPTFEKDKIILLSVGRISHAKNYDNVPLIAKYMKDRGVKFKWYILGPGSHADIDKTIEETGTADVIEILGAKQNPYPYIKACDIYVQPSRYEGKSVTVREAQMLCKPVVVTAYPTAPSQIKNGKDGVIVPMDNEGCAKGIMGVISDKELQRKIIDHLRVNDFGNEAEIKKIYRLLDDK